jgi:ornithine carbamoyltransferase
MAGGSRTATTVAGKRVAFFWDGEGFRNRAAFELGVQLLGGVGVEIPGRLGERERVEDLAGFLDNWFDAVVIRTPSFEMLTAFARAATTPVVNARTRHNHPCEILGDLAFVRSVRGRLDELHVVFVGEPTNLAHSWCEAAAVLPIKVTQVCPVGFEIDRRWWDSLVTSPAGELTHTPELAETVRSADVIYTDCWPARADRTEHDRIERLFAPLRVTAAVLGRARPDALFLPCPPVTRGEEVSADAMTDPRCWVHAAKEWLLHAQNALLEETTSVA